MNNNINLKKLVITLLFILSLVLPLLIVQISPTHPSSGAYVFKARIIKKLNETQTPSGAKPQYFLVEHTGGSFSEAEFVVDISESTKGFSNVNLEINKELWMHGNTTKPDFNRPQISVNQIKDKGFWPNQISELKVLYQSPITNFLHFIGLFYCAFIWSLFLLSPSGNPECSLETFLIVAVKTALIFSTLVLMIKNRHKKWNLILISLAYIFLSIISTIPIRLDLY